MAHSSGKLAVRPLTVEVTSQSDPDTVYPVTLPYCPCADFRYRRGNADSPFCKHLRAALELVGGWHVPVPGTHELR